MDEKSARELLAEFTLEEKERLFALLMGLKWERENSDTRKNEGE